MDEHDFADALLASPAGAAFVLLVEQSSSIDQALEPPEVFRIAAGAVEEVTPWRGDHLEAVREVRALASEKREIATRIVGHPHAQWWFRPLDRSDQVVVYPDGGRDRPIAPSAPPGSWERYAQKPREWMYTSTRRGDASCMQVAIETRTGDWIVEPPLHGAMLSVPGEARVFEVLGPWDWHRLCTDHPATHDEGNRVGPYEFGHLVPDWFSVAGSWDGVHLTLIGLLTSELVRYESPSGWSLHHAWGAEATLWLRDIFTGGRPLADLEEFHDQRPHLRISRGRPLTRWRRSR